MKKKRKPKLPGRLVIDGVHYLATVMRVQHRYEDGTPEDVTIIKDEMTIELSTDPTNNEFIIVYVKESTLRPKKIGG